MTERTLIIGDVHGCLQELDDLLEHSGWTESNNLIFTGDLVAKGPNSKGVLERARDCKARAVCGNHDQHCLQWRQAKQTGSLLPTLSDTHKNVAPVLKEDDWQWLESLPYWLELAQYNALVVHAGLLPGIPLAQQTPSNLMNMRSILDDGSASKTCEQGVPWASLWPGPQLVVFGHDAVRALQRYPHALGIDTGCVYGGELTGLWLPERQLVSVPACKTWAKASQ